VKAEKFCRGKIIFDMDGVITSEECYWNAASLTVWELLFSERYLALIPEDDIPPFKIEVTGEEIASVRKAVFQEDRVISFLKSRAVNSNWDLAFLTFSFQLVRLLKGWVETKGIDASLLEIKEALNRGDLQQLSLPCFLRESFTPSFEEILGPWSKDARGEELMEALTAQLPGSCRKAKEIFAPFSPLWEKVRDVFQEWYLGEGNYRSLNQRPPFTPGKKGLIFAERPLLPAEKIKETLEALLEKGWVLGIATGRPFSELYPPLERQGLWPLFDEASIVTFDDVQKAERALKEKGENVFLGKPHPFSFLKAYWGDKCSQQELLSSPLKRPPRGSCWVVGDSIADLMAAKEMGALFIGVLTGHSGAAARDLFEKGEAHAVLPDITFIPSYLDNLPDNINL